MGRNNNLSGDNLNCLNWKNEHPRNYNMVDHNIYVISTHKSNLMYANQKRSL